MHKMWMVFDPRQAFIALMGFLAVLAFGIHFSLLSTTRFNWLEGAPVVTGALDPSTGILGLLPTMIG